MTPYGERALTDELAILRTTGNGGRNNQLNRSAFAVAQLVAGEQIDADAARSALNDAAAETGLEHREIASTLNNAWKDGMAQPRYVYGDRDGRALYAKTRVGKPDKKYTVEHRASDGAWREGRGGCDAVPYRLADLVAAAKDTTIYMAEGEKHADKLARWGLLATSYQSWSKGFAEHVAGRSVVIIPDNDKGGEDQAKRTYGLVTDAGGFPVIVRLPRLEHKGDIMDWDGDADELRRLTEAALHGPAETFPTLDLAALASVAPSPIKFAIEGIAPEGEVVLFTGPGSSGKSLLAQQFATAAAVGIDALGLSVKPAPAVYVTCEDSAEQLHWRHNHICKAMGLDKAAMADKLHLTSFRGAVENALCTFDHEGRLKATPAFNRLSAHIIATGSRLAFIDNVAHLFTGNENDRGQVTQFVNLLNRLAGDTGATIVLLGHPNKSGDTYSGSTAWLNAVRSQITIDHERDADGSILDPDARVLTLGKANYSRKGSTLRFRWHDFAFILDTDLPDDTRAEIAATVQASAENAAFMDCLAAATGQHRGVSHNPGSNYAPKVFATMPEGKKLSERSYRAAMERLLHVGAIRLDQPLWRGPNRVMKQGIKAAENCTDPPAPTPCTDPPETRTSSARFNPPYTTYKPGGADHGPPPDDIGDPNTWGADQ